MISDKLTILGFEIDAEGFGGELKTLFVISANKAFEK